MRQIDLKNNTMGNKIYPISDCEHVHVCASMHVCAERASRILSIYLTTEIHPALGPESFRIAL